MGIFPMGVSTIVCSCQITVSYTLLNFYYLLDNHVGKAMLIIFSNTSKLGAWRV